MSYARCTCSLPGANHLKVLATHVDLRPGGDCEYLGNDPSQFEAFEALVTRHTGYYFRSQHPGKTRIPYYFLKETRLSTHRACRRSLSGDLNGTIALYDVTVE